MVIFQIFPEFCPNSQILIRPSFDMAFQDFTTLNDSDDDFRSGC